MKNTIAAMVLVCLAAPAGADEVKTFTYKKTKQADLAVHVH